MKGKVFVDMFRIHWNSTVGNNEGIFFDSIKEFKIEYVFGKYKCIPEFCTREQLINVMDKVISKALMLYLKSCMQSDNGIFNIEFCSIMNFAEIHLRAGDCPIFITVEPNENIDDRQY